jgi:GTPase SAR1 family protein
LEGFIVLVGTAGSGKTHLADSFGRWLENMGYSIARVNLDPAVDWLPYSPDIDVRDYVSAQNVMSEMRLGPNGALIASIDMLVGHVNDLKRDISEYSVDYYIIDTPGQMELFAYRSSGPIVLESIIGSSESAVVFLIDPIFVEKPSSLVSALLLSASTYLRLLKPQVNIVSKSDLLLPDIIDFLESGPEEGGLLEELVAREDKSDPLLIRMAEVLDETGFAGRLIPVSSNTQYGFETLYYELQKIFAGGEEKD